MVNPEICSGHLNFRDRDSHFIFGDACTAVLLERETDCKAANPWQLVASKLVTQYSNNIRNNFGFLNRLSPRTRYGDDKLFRQQGRKVFKEVLPLVCEQIANQFIGRKLLGHDASQQEAPVILDSYGNTSSAGFHHRVSSVQSRPSCGGSRRTVLLWRWLLHR